MADFCLRCNIDMGFGPHSDFAWLGEDGTLTEATTAEGKGCVMLCEGCGPTYVDHLGRCMGGCDEGHVPPDADEVLRHYDEWLARRTGRLGWLYRLRDWWAGTPWEPGYKHYLRWRWYDWRDGKTGVMWLDGGPILEDPGEGTILRTGDTGNEGQRGPDQPDLQPGMEEKPVGPGKGPGNPVR